MLSSPPPEDFLWQKRGEWGLRAQFLGWTELLLKNGGRHSNQFFVVVVVKIVCSRVFWKTWHNSILEPKQLWLKKGGRGLNMLQRFRLKKGVGLSMKGTICILNYIKCMEKLHKYLVVKTSTFYYLNLMAPFPSFLPPSRLDTFLTCMIAWLLECLVACLVAC